MPSLHPGAPWTIGSTFWFVPQRVASPVPQVQPQVPQLVGSCFTSASQPSLAIPLQLAKSVAQSPMAHVPLSEQVAAAFGKSHGVHPGTRQPTLGAVSDTHRPLHAFVPAGHTPSVNWSTFDSEQEGADDRTKKETQAAHPRARRFRVGRPLP